MRLSSFVSVVSLLVVAHEATAFKANDFKTCSQSGFCRRGRALAERAQSAGDLWKSPYTVEPSSIVVDSTDASIRATVKSGLYPDINFGLEIRIQEDGVIRARMDEVGGLKKRYDEAASWALIAEPKISRAIQWTVGKKDARAKYGPKKEVEIAVSFEPLQITLYRNGKEQVVVNGQGLLHMEHFRNKPEPPAAVESSADAQATDEAKDDAQAVLEAPPNPRAWFEGDKEDALFEESFGSWTDSKPKGTFVDWVPVQIA
jgi:mannosyl-oligosaccharide alpha-1,3-glucosidase